jgi:uncharacterized protein (TIGR02118 family)
VIDHAMDIALFLSFRDRTRPNTVFGEAEWARLGVLATDLPGLRKALAFTPAATDDPYLDDGSPPVLALQFYFSNIAALEAALADGGRLHEILSPGAFPSLAGAEATEQAMLTRIFPVADAPAPTRSCTYLVSYEGEAEDAHAWLSHYIANHPPLMVRLPGLRELELYTRLDWCSALSARRVDHLQRNKVVFDNEAALQAALNSPVRHEMRADFHKFPSYSGPVTHYPMMTRALAFQRPPR